ncbi:VanZ family protein [Agromyces badenianii]|uniref:VanZ family protein n=2 Tax=Agromyces badenianii TaxID=2080742 RepID=A0A2S0WY63_9MICO|nr:VanZ family protein [Agromyces badenianii]
MAGIVPRADRCQGRRETRRMLELERPRWLRWALIGYVVLAALLLLLPVSFGGSVGAIGLWAREQLGWLGIRDGMIEFAANVALFVPIGVILGLAVRRFWLGFTLAVAFSAGAELVQVFLPSRVASLRDVVANVLGAVVGTFIAAIITAVRRSRAEARTGVGAATDASR